VIEEHVASFNEGVRTGDWSSMLARLTHDAELEFTGLPVGPFRGRAAIGEAYRTQPPDDEIVVLEPVGDEAVAYAWANEPERAAGEIWLETRDAEITRIRVYYETSHKRQ
jgi:hypothetical protein